MPASTRRRARRQGERHLGEWEALAPTGKRFEIAVCTVYRFAPDGLLQSEDVYFDRARLREQLLK
jgi:hypothetical protein